MPFDLPAWLALPAGLTLLFALTAVPLYLRYRSVKAQVARAAGERPDTHDPSGLHLAIIEALARAIAAKDQTSPDHIPRVRIYAAGLARAICMSDEDVQGVMAAALLHDIGNLAVPEHILTKPGPLTAEEFEKIRIHPQMGAAIIGCVPFPYPVVPLILSHHERWDGRGYPAGLKGEAIPLGARVLAIADFFDALTSPRPYHRPMSVDAAVGLLRQEAARALDPRLVNVFLDILPALAREVAREAPLPGSTQAPAFEAIARAHREIYALYELSQAIGTSLSIPETMDRLTSKLSDLVPFSCAALFLLEDATEMVQCRVATGIDAEIINQLAVRMGEGLNGWAARNRQGLVNARPTADFEAAGVREVVTRLQSALVSPLIVHDRLIGTLCVYHLEPSFYADDHRRVLDRVAKQAAAVIKNAILFEQTQEESLTDALTGLPNTRSLVVHLARELARAERLRSHVSLLVMDIDGFKLINDTYGHHMGDRALCLVAHALRAAIRSYDIAVRYAGDEFIIVLSGCRLEEAERKCQELQQVVTQIPFEVKPGQRLPLSVSVGVSVYPEDGLGYEGLLAAADARMYSDKARRKGQGPPPAPDGSAADTGAASTISRTPAD